MTDTTPKEDNAANAIVAPEPAPESDASAPENADPTLTIVLSLLDGRQFLLQAHPSDTTALFRNVLANIPRYCFDARFVFKLADGTTLDDLVAFSEYNLGEQTEVTLAPGLYTERDVRMHVDALREILAGQIMDQSKLSSSSVYSLVFRDQAVEKEIQPETLLEAKLSAFFPPIPQGSSQRCLENIEYSSWNPVPSNRKLRGDIAYLVVKTLEGHTLHITACAAGFYINRTVDDDFDPTPSSRPCMSHSLAGLLGQTSPLFKANFSPFVGIAKLKKLLATEGSEESTGKPDAAATIAPPSAPAAEPAKPAKPLDESTAPDTTPPATEEKAGESSGAAAEEKPANLSKDEILNLLDEQHNPVLDPVRRFHLETVPTLPQLHTTFLAPALTRHAADAARAETFVSGSKAHLDDSGNLINWNEEWQAIMALPLDENMRFRDQSLHELHRKFLTVAVQGAKDIIDGKIMPLSHNRNRFLQLYIYHNIFFAFPETFCENYSLAGSHAYASQDIHAVQYINKFNPSLRTLLETVVDYRGCRLLCQAIIPGVLQPRITTEQRVSNIKYGLQEKELQTFAWDKDFHELVRPLADATFVKEHTVKDKDGKEFSFFFSFESHGLESVDGLNYILDIGRITPFDVNFVPKDAPLALNMDKTQYVPKGVHESCRLRVNFCRYFLDRGAAQQYKAQWLKLVEKKQKENPESAAKDASEEAIVDRDVTVSSEEKAAFDLAVLEALQDWKLNVDAFANGGQVGTDKEKATVEEACKLLTVVVSRFAEALVHPEMSILDGQQLTDKMHAEGINMRYLGRLLDSVLKLSLNAPTAKLYAIKLVVTEMIARVAKRILRHRLKYAPLYSTADEVASFLNLLFDRPVAPATAELFLEDAGLFETVKAKKNSKSKKSKDSSSVETIVILEPLKATADAALEPLENLWQQIFAEIQTHFDTDLLRVVKTFAYGDDLKADGAAGAAGESMKPSFALVSEQFGVGFVPLLRSLCSKTGVQIAARDYWETASNATDVIFQAKDIVSVNPLVKTIKNASTTVTSLLSTAANVEDPKEAFAILRECHLLSMEISGLIDPIHTTILRDLISAALNSGAFSDALHFAKLLIILSERVYGLDHAEVALAYEIMASVLDKLREYRTAITFLLRARYIISLIYGPDHPRFERIDSALAHFYFSLEDFGKALAFAENALKVVQLHNEVDSAGCVSAYTMVGNCSYRLGNFRKALNMFKASYDILARLLGKEHELAQAAYSLVVECIALAAAKEKSVSITRMDAPQQGAAKTSSSAGSKAPSSSTAAAATASAASKNQIPNNIDELVAFINGKKKKRTHQSAKN